MARKKTTKKATKKATKKGGKAKGGKKGAARESLVVASKVKGYVRGKGLIASGELIGAVNDAVHCMLDKAAERTAANRRSTVRPQDI